MTRQHLMTILTGVNNKTMDVLKSVFSLNSGQWSAYFKVKVIHNALEQFFINRTMRVEPCKNNSFTKND